MSVPAYSNVNDSNSGGNAAGYDNEIAAIDSNSVGSQGPFAITATNLQQLAYAQARLAASRAANPYR